MQAEMNFFGPDLFPMLAAEPALSVSTLLQES